MFLDLPLEIVELILLKLPLNDVLNLTAVNKALRDIILNSQYLWYHHLHIRSLEVSDDGTVNSLDKFKIRYKWMKRLETYLITLSYQHIYYSVVEINIDEGPITELLGDRAFLEITFRYLNNTVATSNRFTNLTRRLYARYLLVALTQADIISKLELLKSSTSPNVFTGSVLISRWVGACLHEPDKHCIPVTDVVDGIVWQCRERLTPSSTVEDVIAQINTSLYKEYGLTKNTDNFYDLDNNRVDKVLYKKTGIPITLAIIYHEIAQRLGLTLHLVNFPRHFLLAYTSSTGHLMYIDCFNEGLTLSRSQCLQLCPMYTISDKDEYFAPASTLHVLARLIRNIELNREMGWGGPNILIDDNYFQVNIYKMFSHLIPEDVDGTAIAATRFSLNLGVKFPFLRRFTRTDMEYELYCEALETRTVELRDRLTHRDVKPGVVRFNVGDVMLHKRYNYTCVIYGWDEVCSLGSAWEERMGVSQLEYQAEQPFYKVLPEDQTERYVAQENLITTRSAFIEHRHVGKYFCLYDGERFVPNAALRHIYSYIP